MKITTFMTIFQVIYVVHWNNFRIYILSTSKKHGASVASDNDIDNKNTAPQPYYSAYTLT